MRIPLSALWILLSAAPLFSQETPDLLGEGSLLRTNYQQAGPYDPRFDLKADAVMVYGVQESDLSFHRDWSEKSGSRIQTMTGVAWGNYQDFLNGKIDGVDHWDDAQVRSDGERVMHDGNIPYLNPSVAFGDYLLERLKKVVDAGVTEIFLEEPEFWAFSGYGESFKREWRIFYGEDWIRPDASCDAQYRASRLKAYLYRRVLSSLAAGLKEYSLKKYDRPLSVYVATHSLLSYAQIQMVSPEATLIDLPGIDGLIAQVWTGTARCPNLYRGVEKERTFESALLEYGVMQEMARGTGKRTYFLNDPVEDDPKHDWNDYRTNYLCTLTASLFRSETAYYEVAPWPSRVFLGAFPADSPDAATIPADYASILCAGFQQLRDMAQTDVSWHGATEGIGVFLSDSAMFQRGEQKLWKNVSAENAGRTEATRHEVSRMSGFFGLTMPLLKNGIPAEVPVLDHLTRFPGYLDPYNVLVLSYEFQKPLSAGIHAELADWVRRGGVLVCVGAGSDPFHETAAWWNTGRADYQTPYEHLFESLGLKRDAPNGVYDFGRGKVIVDRTEPAFYSRSKENADAYLAQIKRAVELSAQTRADSAEGENARSASVWAPRNYFLKSRGPYTLAACLVESISDEPLKLNGRFIDLFDANLPVLHEVIVRPNERKWLLDLDRVTAEAPRPLVCGGRISDWKAEEGGVTFRSAGPQGVETIARILLSREPSGVTVGGEAPLRQNWDAESKTLYLAFPNRSADPTEVVIRY